MKTWEMNQLKDFKNLDIPDWCKILLPDLKKYSSDFLCKNHPFRNGKVCPFMPAAIKKNRVLFTLGDNDNNNSPQRLTTLENSLDLFDSMRKKESTNAAIIT